MDQLFAKVKRRGKANRFVKLLSGEKTFDSPEIVEILEYSPDTLLEETQWFKIEEFSKQNYCLAWMTEDWDSTWLGSDKVDFEKIEYLVSYQDESVFYFQRIFARSILRNKRFLSFGDTTKLENKQNTLVLSDCPDAIYDIKDDILYFKKLEAVAPIFKGIEQLYHEATEDDVRGFLAEPFISCKNGFDSGKVGKLNKHRLAMAKTILASLTDIQRRDIFTYTDEYYPGLNYNGTSFDIATDDDLKNLCYGISQRFYTTPVTHEKRIANSVIPIND